MPATPTCSSSSKLAVLGLTLLAACASQGASGIDGDDNAFLPSVRVSLPFEDSTEDEGNAWQTGLRLDIEGSGGEFTQTLSPVAFVRLENNRIDGPGELAVDFDHAFVGLGLFARKTGGAFRFEGGVGVGESFLDADVSLGTSADSMSLNSLGIYVMGSITYQVLDPLGLVYELQGFAGEDDVHIFKARLGAEWAPTKNMAISVGVENWEYTLDRGGSSLSDVNFQLHGPFVRIEYSL